MLDVLSEFYKYQPLTGRIFRGKVVYVDDRRKLGRIKVQIPEVFPWGEDEYKKLPWIYPLYPSSIGIHPLSSSFSVPLLRSEVLVIFFNDLPYFGFYVATTTDRKNRQIDFHSEYPYRYGHQDPIGNKEIINLWTATKEFRTPDGALGVHEYPDTDFKYQRDNVRFWLNRKEEKAYLKFGSLEINYDKGNLSIYCPSISISSEKVTAIIKDLLTLIGDELHE